MCDCRKKDCLINELVEAGLDRHGATAIMSVIDKSRGPAVWDIVWTTVSVLQLMLWAVIAVKYFNLL